MMPGVAAVDGVAAAGAAVPSAGFAADVASGAFVTALLTAGAATFFAAGLAAGLAAAFAGAAFFAGLLGALAFFAPFLASASAMTYLLWITGIDSTSAPPVAEGLFAKTHGGASIMNT